MGDVNALQTINKLLARLDTDQLDQVRDRVTVLRSMTKTEPGIEVGAEARFALHCIVDCLKRRRVDHPDIGLLSRSKLMSSFRKKAIGVMRFLDAGKFASSERRVILMMGIGWLYDDIMEGRRPATAQRLMMEFHRIPALIRQRGFPYDLQLVKQLVFMKRRGKR